MLHTYDFASKSFQTLHLRYTKSDSNYELTPIMFSHTLMHIITTVINVRHHHDHHHHHGQKRAHTIMEF